MEFTHRSVLWANRSSILKGTLCLVGLDAIVLMLPLIVKAVIDKLQNHPLPTWMPQELTHLSVPQFILIFCALYLLANVLMAYIRYWWRVHLVWSTFPLFHRWRQDLFRHFMSLDREFFKTRKVGDLISALTSDTENVRMTLSIGTLMIIDALINFLMIPFLLWRLSPSLTLMVIPPLVLLSVLALFLSDRLAHEYERVQELTADLSGRAFEMISGIRVIKAFRREQPIHREFMVESEKLRDASLKVARYQGLFGPGLEFALGLAIVCVLVFGGFKVLAGTLALSSLVAFQIYLTQMDWPMMAVGWFIQMYRSSQASQKRIQKFAEQKSSLKLLKDLPTRSLENLFEFDRVHFSFGGVRQFQIVNWNFKIRPGGFVGITGPVGGGKSTFLELLSRQRDPTEGDIYYRGRNLKTMRGQEVSEKILYVPQESFLFSRSLRSNLAFGLEDYPDDLVLWEILRDLRFDRETWAARGGLSIRLGEKGLNFSGGQRQRISLGRALCRSRDVFLFDDVFSHVDVETESEILKAVMRRIPKDSTVLMVSQRLETLKMCREVLVFADGNLEFQGALESGLENNAFLMELQMIQMKQRGAS